MTECLTKNCKGQRTEHRGMTCHDGKPKDDHSTYHKVRRKQEDFCPGNDKKAGNRRVERSSNEQDTCNIVRNKQENSGTHNDKEAGSRKEEQSSNEPEYPIKTCKNQRTEHRGMPCHSRRFLKEQSASNDTSRKQENSCTGNDKRAGNLKEEKPADEQST